MGYHMVDPEGAVRQYGRLS